MAHLREYLKEPDRNAAREQALMTKKIGDKKIKSIKSSSVEATKGALTVSGTEAVGKVGAVKAATGVGDVRGASAIGKRQPTRIMTMSEREQLLQMINEEAEKLVESGALPASKKEVIAHAVRMTVDASIIDDKDKE